MNTPILTHDGVQTWDNSVRWTRHTKVSTLDHLPHIDQASTAYAIQIARDAAVTRGTKAILAPMRAHPWFPFGVRTGSPEIAPFLLEPDAPTLVGDALMDNDFTPIHTQESWIRTMDMDIPSPTGAQGPTIITMSPTEIPRFMTTLYDGMQDAIKARPFHATMSYHDMQSLYDPIIQELGDRVVTMLAIAPKNGIPCGYLFGFIDPLDQEHPRYIIHAIKGDTDTQRALILALYHQAQDMGITAIIHACMDQDSHQHQAAMSLGATMFRQYTLYGYTRP